MPDGYGIRELVDEDIPAKVELMGVSMGTGDNRTVEKYYNMQKSIVYDRRTDLVVVALPLLNHLIKVWIE